VRTIVILIAFGAAVGIGYAPAWAGGRWWIGLIMLGIVADNDGELDMPTSREPLRLLLSGWTYPEPRADLAIRE
jgi:hypothetical protein